MTMCTDERVESFTHSGKTWTVEDYIKVFPADGNGVHYRLKAIVCADGKPVQIDVFGGKKGRVQMWRTLALADVRKIEKGTTPKGERDGE